MLEIKLLNTKIVHALANSGHMDEIIICDAGFPIPKEIETIDISLTDYVPTIYETLEVIKEYFSVEKVILTNETFEHNPTYFKEVSSLFGKDVEVEIIPHIEFKKRSRNVKVIIRTGDFTAWGNILLVSGPGKKWEKEKE